MSEVSEFSELQDLINSLDVNFERQLARLKRIVADLGRVAEELEESGEERRASLPKS